jgi:hypothetical protein
VPFDLCRGIAVSESASRQHSSRLGDGFEYAGKELAKLVTRI